MLKFEEIGVELQKTAKTVDQANRRYETSCDICASRGLYIRCEYCHIREAHRLAVAALSENKETNQCNCCKKGE